MLIFSDGGYNVLKFTIISIISLACGTVHTNIGTYECVSAYKKLIFRLTKSPHTHTNTHSECHYDKFSAKHKCTLFFTKDLHQLIQLLLT